jgi:predicted ester cyclase
MSAEQNKQSVREFTRIFKNEHNVDGIDHLFAANFKHNFKMPLKPGLEGFKDLGRMMNGAFPNVVVTEQDLIASADKVVERSKASGTNSGSFMGMPATGKKVEWTEIHIYEFDAQGKIREHWAELSMFELVNQLKG